MLKIAYLATDRGIPVFGNKGGSVHTREIVNALSILGHQVTVLAARRGDCVGLPGVEVIEVGAGVSPKRKEEKVLGKERRDLRSSSAKREEEKILGKERRDLRSSSAIMERLVQIHAKEKFDFIYERYSLWSTAGVRAARKLDIPCLIEVNAPLLIEQERYRKISLFTEARKVEAEVFSGADAILAVSEQVRAYALSKGAVPERSYVIQNGADVKRFHSDVVPAHLSGVDGKFVIGFAGSLKEWHGVDVLLEAFRRLQNPLRSYHLLLVGDGPKKDWIEGYIQGARLTEVTMTGWVPYDRLPGMIQRMDVAVAPYPRIEGFYFSPLKIFEYMAAGRPVVASRTGQILDVVQDGKNGLLTAPGDPEDLAEKVDQLYSNPELRASIGVEAAQSALHCTWEKNALRITEIADLLIRKK